MEVKNYNLKLKQGKAVCFDFDGVIHKYREGWKDGTIYDKCNYEMIKLISFLQNTKIPVFICSTREPEQIKEWWMKQNINIPITVINDETFWNDFFVVGVTNRKLPAQLYIDDRAYKYDGQTMKEFIVENSELRDKTIELMAEYIESKNLLIDKNLHVLTAESIKEYFKNKVKRIDFLNKEEKKNIETFIEKCKKYDESVEIKGVTVGEESRILDTVCKTLNQIEKLQKENEKLKNKLLDTLDGKKVIEEETPQYIKENYISKEKIEEWRKSKDKSLMWSNADDLYYFNKWTKELLESEE